MICRRLVGTCTTITCASVLFLACGAEDEDFEGLYEESVAADEPVDETQQALGTCTAWSPWKTASTYCGSDWWCWQHNWGEATFAHEYRVRTCYFNNDTWPENQNRSVRRSCGC